MPKVGTYEGGFFIARNRCYDSEVSASKVGAIEVGAPNIGFIQCCILKVSASKVGIPQCSSP